MSKNKSRPLSPHLTIYKPQITSMLSILHRITGACLFFGLILLSWLLVFVLIQATGLGLFDVDFSILFNSMFFKTILLGLIFCLYYHALNGIRHLFWDLGLGINNKAVTISGIVTLAATIILTIATLCIASYNHF